MADYLLDATALIDYLRGRRGIIELVNTLANQGHRLGLCCISVAEVYAGLNEEERAGADRLTDAMDYYEISREAAKEAGRYRYEFARRGTTLTTTDTLIAATAIAEGAILITANTRDFPMEEIQLLAHP
ncbi:MAG: PIN domain-containing protein [Chloroflexi bacterium]|nr:PIN domain-containing protein [Chloroflexota bacterium]